MLVRCDSVMYFRGSGDDNTFSANVAFTPIGAEQPEQFGLTYSDRSLPLEFEPNKYYTLSLVLTDAPVPEVPVPPTLPEFPTEPEPEPEPMPDPIPEETP